MKLRDDIRQFGQGMEARTAAPASNCGVGHRGFEIKIRCCKGKGQGVRPLTHTPPGWGGISRNKGWKHFLAEFKGWKAKKPDFFGILRILASEES